MKLQQLIRKYLDYRQVLGWRLDAYGGYLGGFGRFVGTSTNIVDVRAEQVQAFLAGAGPITSTWHTKYSILRSFYRYAISRGYVAMAPLPAWVPKRPPAFVPYIYSHHELRHLLQAAESVRRPRSCLEPITVRTALMLLYGAGLRLREALNLNRGDMDGAQSLLTVQRSKFGKTRLVPLGPQLTAALRAYAQTRVPGTDGPLFTTRMGTRIRNEALQEYFRVLCERAGIRRADTACYQPRLHDLRHTFAVHRLTAWYRQGADVQQLLPKLSTYLGHVHIRATQAYLSMTPELLQEAVKRFEQYTETEVRHG